MCASPLLVFGNTREKTGNQCWGVSRLCRVGKPRGFPHGCAHVRCAKHPQNAPLMMVLSGMRVTICEVPLGKDKMGHAGHRETQRRGHKPPAREAASETCGEAVPPTQSRTAHTSQSGSSVKNRNEAPQRAVFPCEELMTLEDIKQRYFPVDRRVFHMKMSVSRQTH